jgi:hypothetical protein
MMRAFVALGAVTSLVAAAILNKARTRAEEQGRPLADVLREMVQRLPQDLSTIPDDVKRAVHDGRIAAAQRQAEVEEMLRRAREARGRTSHMPPPQQPPA